MLFYVAMEDSAHCWSPGAISLKAAFLLTPGVPSSGQLSTHYHPQQHRTPGVKHGKGGGGLVCPFSPGLQCSRNWRMHGEGRLGRHVVAGRMLRSKWFWHTLPLTTASFLASLKLPECSKQYAMGMSEMNTGSTKLHFIVAREPADDCAEIW